VHLAGPERVTRWELGRRFVHIAALPADVIEAGESTDASRPRDVSLVSDWHCGRSLDDALRAS
jgi:hypothetical protein